jgi:uncharacterized protein YggE
MERRSTLVGAAVVAALLVTAGVAGALTTGNPAQPQVQSDAQMSDTITVAGSGSVQAQADRAVVRVAVLATGDDIGTVRQQLSDNASQMRSALNEMDISGSQIQTAYYDISSNQRYGRTEEGQPNYRAIHSFSVTVENPDKAGKVIDTAVSNGASEVDGVEFTLSEDRRQELRQEALTEAMETARGEASTIAAAEDLSIAGVDRVSSTDYGRSPYRVETAALASGDSGTSIDSGPVTVSASVTVVYDSSE